MTEAIDLHLHILPEPQRLLWEELVSVPNGFILYGGTAIALHLGHRESVDFDFFGDHAFDPATLLETFPFLQDATVTQQQENTLSVIVNRSGPVKMSFFGVPRLGRLDPPLIAPDNGLQIASLRDLAGTKVSVVQRRAEAKDYIDIDAILRNGEVTLPVALATARVIYGTQFNPQLALKALSFFDDDGLRDLPAALKGRLAEAVRDVDLGSLPVLSRPMRPRTNPGEPQ